MKYLVIIPDGLTDLPVKELNNRTPLETADIPHINYLLQKGKTGAVKTVPQGMSPGSDVANLSIMGVDPKKLVIGRGALEALAQNIRIEKDETVFRANFVTIKDNILADYSGGEIENKHAQHLIKILQQGMDRSIRLYPGVSYRNLAVIKKSPMDIVTFPPHDITDRKINPYLPKGRDSSLVRDLMLKSQQILAQSDYIKKNRIKANSLWLWGQGHVLPTSSFYERYKLRGAVISAVDIIKGIARLLKMDVIRVPGITGNFNTNYSNKFKYAVKNLKKYDFIYLHVEATDEAGHCGNYQEKIRAIENIDRLIVKPLLETKIKEDLTVILLPDHPTPVRYRTHINKEVPFILYNKKEIDRPNHSFTKYNEAILKKPPVFISHGWQFLEKIKNNHI